MITSPESERPEDWNNELAKLDADLKIDALLERALKGNPDAIQSVIEPVGNDDNVTKALVGLLALARVDEMENTHSKHYSAKVSHVRNNRRVQAFVELTEAVDKYYEEVFTNE